MMDNSEIYVGLDIGTTSIKVIIAEHVKGQANIIGYGNTKSAGLNRGVIIKRCLKEILYQLIMCQALFE